MAPGVDPGIGRFAAKQDEYLAGLSAAIREGKYQPQAVKRVDIPKGPGLSRLRAGGRTRPLGIPTVKDRIMAQPCFTLETAVERRNRKKAMTLQAPALG